MANPATKTHYIPVGYHTATPYLIVNDAARALDWYRDVFGAREVMRFPMPGGKIGHAETKIGDSHIMLADEYPDMGYRGPLAHGGTPVSIMIYVEDVDAVFKNALAHGAQVRQELKDQFYGDRNGTIIDPFGHVWTIATHIEDVTPEEMRRRMEQQHK